MKRARMHLIGVWLPLNYTLNCLSTFVDTLLFTAYPVLRTLPIHGIAKFQYIGIYSGAFLRVNDGLLLNIIVFTLDFPISQQRKIPVLWNFAMA